MEIITLKKNTREDWNEFVYASDDAWLDHLWEHIEMDIVTRGGKNVSFMVKNGTEVVAIMPLILRKFNTRFRHFRELIGSGVSGPAFRNGLSYKLKKKIEKAIFNEIDGIAKSYGALRASFKITPLAPNRLVSNAIPTNYRRYGHSDITMPARIIDLKLDEKKLWGGVRRQLRSLINSGKKKGLVFKEQEEITDDFMRELYNVFTLLVQKTGYDTFPYSVFEKRRKLILDKELAKVFVAKKDNELVGALIINVFKGCAHYASGCEHPDYYDYNIGHFMQWEAIKALKKEGYNYYNMGWQQYIQAYDVPSQKELSIAFFKRGFGGYDVPMWGGEKYYRKWFYYYNSIKRVLTYGRYIGKL